MNRYTEGAAGRFSTALVMTAAWAWVVAGCGKGSGEQVPDSVRPVVDVKVDSIRLGNIPEVLSATGKTRVLRQENIGSPIEGKVTSLRVLEGDRVESGQVIAVVETKEGLATRTGAELLVARARSAEEKVRAEAGLERARRAETALEIRAPFAGVVAARGVNEGEFVAPGGTIATLVDLESLYFVARVPARDLSRLAAGQAANAEFQSWPGRRFRCRVETIQPQVDPAAQTAEVRLRFLVVSADLRSDMFGQAEIVVGEHRNVLLVPGDALLRDDETGRHAIVEAVGDSLGVVSPVDVGIRTPTVVEISAAGLRAGLHVVVEGHYGLPDSTRLHVQRGAEPGRSGSGSLP